MANIDYRHAIFAAVVVGSSSFVGCQRSENIPISGTVIVGNNAKEISGTLVFLPIDANRAPVSQAAIVNGRYRIDARGGIVPGQYRVQVDAKRKTGRQVTTQIRGETVTSDEYEPIVPPAYASADSPLLVTVAPDSDGRLDLTIPQRD